jgi:hypothetical protein
MRIVTNKWLKMEIFIYLFIHFRNIAHDTKYKIIQLRDNIYKSYK